MLTFYLKRIIARLIINALTFKNNRQYAIAVNINVCLKAFDILKRQ